MRTKAVAMVLPYKYQAFGDRKTIEIDLRRKISIESTFANWHDFNMRYGINV